MQNSKFFLGSYPDPRFSGRAGEESLFLFLKNVPKLSYNNAEFKKFSGVIIPPDPVLREGKGGLSLFCSLKMYLKTLTAMQNSQIFPRVIPRTPV